MTGTEIPPKGEGGICVKSTENQQVGYQGDECESDQLMDDIDQRGLARTSLVTAGSWSKEKGVGYTNMFPGVNGEFFGCPGGKICPRIPALQLGESLFCG